MRAAWTAGLLTLLLALGGCAAAPENEPLAPMASNPQRWSALPDSADRPVILMAFSGGGSRAAALAAAVLGELSRTRYPAGAEERSLVEDVKVVSSVSGGSVTAAWFGLEGGDGMDELRRRFLAQDNMRSLILTGVNPVTWLRLAFTDYTRIDALKELLDERLFDGRTFAELNAPGKPIVILNATDMGSGQVFAFTPQRFDDICSSLDDLPVSVGVAASAAFPIFLTPVDFHNNSADCPGAPPEQEWIDVILESPESPYVNLPDYRAARYANDLRRGEPRFRDIRELHFLDGGVADNLGISSLRWTLLSPYDDSSLLTAINDGAVKRVVVIVVNARSDPPSELDTDPGTPGIIDMLGTVTSVPIDSTTASMDTQLRDTLENLAKDAIAAAPTGTARFADMKVYGVLIDFDQLPAGTPAERDLRDRVKQIPTLWTLTPEELALIDGVGPMLLQRDPCYRLLLADLGAPPPAIDSPVDPQTCTTLVKPPSE